MKALQIELYKKRLHFTAVLFFYQVKMWHVFAHVTMNEAQNIEVTNLFGKIETWSLQHFFFTKMEDMKTINLFRLSKS